MKSAKKLLDFDFDADTFSRNAPNLIEIPKKNLEILEKIIKNHGDTGHQPPDQEDRHQIYRLFIDTPPNRLSAEFDTFGRIRRLAWALTISEDGLPQIVDTPKLRNALQLIENRFQIKALLGVFNALMQAWDRPNAELLRAFVKKHLADYDGHRKSVLRLKDHINWYCENDGTTQLARHLLHESKQLSDVWSYLELPDHTHGYTYFGVVAEAYVDSINNRLDREAIKDVVKFVEKHNNDKTRRAVLSRLIEKLGHDADKVLRQPVQSYALKKWGDPRITGGEIRWRGVSDEAIQIFTRWITKEDLRFFFDVVAKACDDQKFAYRKAFWLAYLEHISFCRPVLRQNAESLFRNDPQILQYYRERRPATLTGGNSNQHAFIIQMGNYTFVEFSTAGACYVYDDIMRPFSLGESQYSMSELRWKGRETHWQPHPGSERYLWQRNFKRWIKSKLGLEPLRSYRLDAGSSSTRRVNSSN